MKIKLRKEQEEAIDFFDEYGYLVINDARQTGKTEVIKEIIRRNRDKRIGIMCPNRDYWQSCYRDIKEEVYQMKPMVNKVPSINFIGTRVDEVDFIVNKFDIIIGDEVFVNPFLGFNFRVKTVSACTPRYIIKTIHNEKELKKKAKIFKKILNKEHYSVEYGQFIK